MQKIKHFIRPDFILPAFIILACFGILFLSCSKKNTSTPIVQGENLTPHPWQAIASPLSGDLADIKYVSTDTAYIHNVTGSQAILKSVNGGVTWDLLHSFKTSDPRFTAFCPLNSKLLFAARDSLYQSKDGGVTWQSKGSAWNGTSATQIVFTDFFTGYILTTDKIYKTVDSGITWGTPFSFNAAGYSFINFPTSLTGYVAGGALLEINAKSIVNTVGVLSNTTDKGQSWNKLDTGSALRNTQRFKQITALDFQNERHGVLALVDQTLIETTDGATTFTTKNVSLPAIMLQVKYDLSGRLYMISGNKIFSSDDNGKTIGLEFTGNSDLLKIAVSPTNQIFIIGRNGQILKRM